MASTSSTLLGSGSDIQVHPDRYQYDVHRYLKDALSDAELGQADFLDRWELLAPQLGEEGFEGSRVIRS